MAAPAAAQILDGGTTFLPELDVRGRGWGQIFNTREMLEFGLALIETTLFTAVIAYHPVILAQRRTRADFEAARLLFIYALIGMLVGFLVIHHGYLIGFVIFGIGGLVRVKSELEVPGDTSRLLIVTLAGLCVGLDLPVMGLITTLGAWVVILLLSGRSHHTVEVKFDDKAASPEKLEALKARLAERGFITVSLTKSKFKPVAEYVVYGRNGHRREALLREMAAAQADPDSAIEDWHLE